jgi:hypothetical protein
MSPVKRRALMVMRERRRVSPSTVLHLFQTIVNERGWHMECRTDLERERCAFEVKITTEQRWELVEAALLPLQRLIKLDMVRIGEEWEVNHYPMHFGHLEDVVVPRRRHLGYTYYLCASFPARQ